MGAHPALRRVLVTGASGNTGSALLEALAGSGIERLAATRGEGTQRRLPEGCGQRILHYGNAYETAKALEGVDAAFLLVPFHEDMVAWGRQFTDLARQQGLRFILRLSGLAAAPDCASKIGALHGAIDEYARDSGILCCILRCNAFMQNYSGLYRHMIRRGLLCLPEGDARSAMIDTGDIAAAAARILADPAPHAGRVYDLNGPEPLSHARAVDIVSGVAGFRVRYRAISPSEARQSYLRYGIPPWHIGVLDSLGRFIRQGNAALADHTTEELLGRPPTRFREFAERHRDCWINREKTST